MSKYPVPGPMNGPEEIPVPDNRPADEQTVEMLENLLPRERRASLKAAREAGEQTGKRRK